MARLSDAEVLHEVAGVRDGCGWLPLPGTLSSAERLRKEGLLKIGGHSVMPPHKLYFLTDTGKAVVDLNDDA